jgi:hypothetical protein
MNTEILNLNEQSHNLVEANISNLSRLWSKLPDKIKLYLPENPVEMISNQANPPGVKFEDLPALQQELFVSALENRSNIDPIQVFSYFPKCYSRCDGCRYNIETLRETNNNPESSSQKYIDNQILFARSIFDTLQGNTSINNWYEGGGTATLQTIDDLRKKWINIRELFGVEKNGSITIEGNPIDFCKDKYVEGLINNIREVFGVDWEIRFSMGGFGFDILGRTEPEDSLTRAINNINKVSDRLHAKININVDVVYGSTGSEITDQLERLKRILNLGVRNITLYGWEKSPSNQKCIEEYTQEYFAIKEYLNKFAQENSLVVQSSPSSLGGDWINLANLNELNKVEYLDGRWGAGQDLIALTGYSLLELEIEGRSNFIRMTTPQLTGDVEKLANSIRDGRTKLGFDRQGVEGFSRVETYNSNLRALNLLHYSGNLYKNLLSGEDLVIVWNILKTESFEVCTDENGEFMNLNNQENKLVLECVMKILSENFSPLV